MKMTTHSSNDIRIVNIEGEMNAFTSDNIEERLNQLIMGGNLKLVINLEKLKYISSAGLRVLLTTNKTMKKLGGSLSLCSLNDTVLEVFEISGFHLIFPIYKSEEEAVSVL